MFLAAVTVAVAAMMTATPSGGDQPIGARNVVWARKASYAKPAKLIYYALV